MVDCGIAFFDAKYKYEFWRPITAIRNGDIDGNPATERDASWEPIDATPLHPEYPCAHCVQSSTAAAVIQGLLGGDEIPEVALTSPFAPGVTHRFNSLRAFTDEVANARIYAGFHYRFSTDRHRAMRGEGRPNRPGLHQTDRLFIPIGDNVAGCAAVIGATSTGNADPKIAEKV